MSDLTHVQELFLLGDVWISSGSEERMLKYSEVDGWKELTRIQLSVDLGWPEAVIVPNDFMEC